VIFAPGLYAGVSSKEQCSYLIVMIILYPKKRFVKDYLKKIKKKLKKDKICVDFPAKAYIIQDMNNFKKGNKNATIK